ncbi:hypothetical protein ABEX47_31235 [Paenibacillus ehimensis]|uniref:hypothetical protein n=1 Tax=Paenibacillus ehimensis TaxID=79264 RepID=UPI0004716776|nr:hypothetical protein [Paenibacillus ehimensis]MEC0211374.1 hypothetical protein [Paenibacillus ehimensis]
MKIKQIKFPTPLTEIKDIENDNIDVIVELEDGFSYTVVVTTPKNLMWYMKKENLNYIPASSLEIIVSSLTEANIYQAIENFSQGDAFWLKLYYLTSVSKDVFDLEKIDKQLQDIKRFNDELEKY